MSFHGFYPKVDGVGLCFILEEPHKLVLLYWYILQVGLFLYGNYTGIIILKFRIFSFI